MRHIIFLLFMLAACRLSAQVQYPAGITGIVNQDPDLSGCNYASYFNAYNFIKSQGQTTLTPAPAGYEPYYISTYARHGSRWLGATKQYESPIKTLKIALSKKQLTAQGQKLLQELKKIASISTKDNLGQLTTVGAAQHKDIATRMCANFPEVFDAQGEYFAQSSTVLRCIKSMNSESKVIEDFCHAKVTQVSGIGDMQNRLASAYMNTEMDSLRRIGYKIYANEKAKTTPYKRICSQFFRNTSWLTVDQQKEFVQDLFDIAQNMKSHDLEINLMKYYTPSEIESLWNIENHVWYLVAGGSMATGNLMPLRGKYQLQDIIEGADSVVYRKDWHGTNLRFGHDTFLMPLACLMELGTCGVALEEKDIDNLDKTWRIQEISPMGGNIQLIFYRQKNGNGPILIKALLNEREVSLPGTAVEGPYYRWEEIRNHWYSKII